MQVEIGKVYEGTVKNITNYGMFVNIHNPEGEHLMGMVHISEVSRKYVSEIRDFVTEGQQVRVKAIGINPQGKISLSMKQVEESSTEENASEGHAHAARGENAHNANQNQNRSRRSNHKPNVYEPKKKTVPAEMTFEDMLSRFKQNSEERMCDIKRNTERKNRSRRK